MNKLRNMISIVAPNSDIANISQQVVSEFGNLINVYEGNLRDGVQAAKKAISDGAKIIVCRGYTGQMIEEELNIPVVPITFSGIDLVRTIENVSIKHRCLGIIGSRDLIGDIKDTTGIFGYKLHVEEATLDDLLDPQRHKEKVAKMHNKFHVDAFIGGKVTMRSTSELGYDFYLIKYGIESVRRAINNAILLAKMKLNETEKNIHFKAIAQNSSEGIIIVNEKMEVVYVNPMAETFINANIGQATGQNINEIISNFNIVAAINGGEQILSEYKQINKAKIITNYVPVVLNDAKVGCIMTFQDVTRIEELEKKIRKEQHAKGLIAKYTFDDILTNDNNMIKVMKNAKRMARADSTVLITGESGIGKELMAQSLHNHSIRRDGPFVAINCAALPENLLESELFGYVDGAFTGARKGGKPGLFELAHLGTIFLDEIADMPLHLQSHLLRVIQEKEVNRIGDDRVIPVNVRIIAATNKDLKEQIKARKFREDLFYRLNVLNIKIPPLRERAEDIVLLTNYFIDYYCNINGINKKSITEKALEYLKLYSWPGNVRELQNFIESIVIVSEKKVIDKVDMEEILLDKLDNATFYNLKNTYEKNQKISEYKENTGVLNVVELQRIIEVLNEVGGNRRKAAEILGLSSTTLWRRLKELNM